MQSHLDDDTKTTSYLKICHLSFERSFRYGVRSFSKKDLAYLIEVCLVSTDSLKLKFIKLLHMLIEEIDRSSVYTDN